MPCITLSSGKTVCYGDKPTTYSQGGTIFFNHQPVHFPDGGEVDLKLNRVPQPVQDEFNMSGGFHGDLFHNLGAHGDLNYGPLNMSGQATLSGYNRGWNPNVSGNLNTNVQVNPKLNVSGNLNYDYNKGEGSQFSPTIGANYQANPNLNIGGSFTPGSNNASFSIIKKFPGGGQTIKKGPGPFLIPEARTQFKSMPVANRFDPRFMAYQDSARINQNSVRDLEAFNKAANNKQPYTASAQTYDDNYNTTSSANKSTYVNPRNTKNHLNPSKSIQGLTEEQRGVFHGGFNTADNGTPENLPTALYSADVTNPAMYKDEQLWLPYHTNPVQPYHVEGPEPIASKLVGTIPNSYDRPLMDPHMQFQPIVGTGYTPKSEGITIPVPTVEITQQTAAPRSNAVLKKNVVNPKSRTKTNVHVGIDQREIMDRNQLDSLRESVGLEPKGYANGGKTTFNFPVSKERQLAEQARMQGDMPTAPGVVKAQEKIREQEAVKKKLANQPTVKLSSAQKKDIDDKNLKQDLLAEMMLRNKQSLSNPNDRTIEADIAKDLGENGVMGLADAPIKGATALVTGRYQTPSQAIGRWANQNNHQMLRNAMIDDQFNPTGLGMVTDFGGEFALGKAGIKGINSFKSTLVDPIEFQTAPFIKNKKFIPVSKEVIQNFKDLKYAEDFAKIYGYKLPSDLKRVAQSNELTNRTIRGMMDRHNSFVRGVSTNWDEIQNVLKNEHGDKGVEIWNNIVKNFENQGIDYINNPKAAAEFMSTHIPINTGYGRASLNKAVFDANQDALYTSNSIPTAEGYTYGDGYIFKVKKPTDYSSLNRQDWIHKNNSDYYDNELPKKFYSDDEIDSYKNLLKNINEDKSFQHNIIIVKKDGDTYSYKTTMDDYWSDISKDQYNNIKDKARTDVTNILSERDKQKLLRTERNLHNNLNSNNKYSHYIHIGTPGEKVLDPLRSWRITPDIWKNKSRAHTGEYTEKLSALELGGFIKQDGGKNTKTIKLSTGKIITLK